MEFDYSWDYGGGTPYDNWSWDAGATSPDFFQSDAYKAFTGWGDPYGPGSSGDVTGAGGGNWLNTALGALGSVGGFLGKNANWLGPAASGLAGLGGGLIGSNASSDAAALQSQALNRALSLQEAQWLQQQANQAPWVQAGQQALPQLQRLAGQGAPAPFQPPPAFDWQVYGLPGSTPTWTPSTYAGYTPTDTPSAAAYRYTPGQGPQASQYRYTPGQIPGAAQYRYTPGAVPTLSGQELLANDPGVQFRLDEGRRALEASAAARGGLTSGATLAALQRQGQKLSSQEYANAYQRAVQQAQLREGWAQQASQMGFGQAMSEAQLREQVKQIASQQGWSQAQAEAAFREQLAQQAGAQNWQQAMQEAQQRAQQAQFGWQAGFQGQQQAQREAQAYDTDLYNRWWQHDQEIYRRALQGNQSEYERALQAYNSQNQQQTLDWNRFAALAGLGQTAVGQLGTQGAYNAQQMGSLLGQLGNAGAGGALGGGQAWASALGNLGNAVSGGLQGAQFQNTLSALMALNR